MFHVGLFTSMFHTFSQLWCYPHTHIWKIKVNKLVFGDTPGIIADNLEYLKTRIVLFQEDALSPIDE